MSAAPGRIARFVQAARSLMVLQLLLGLLAALVAIWAFVEVRGLAGERDQLRNRVSELETQANMQGALPPAPAPLPPPIDPYTDYNVMGPLPANIVIPNAVEPPVNIQLPPPAEVSNGVAENSFRNQVGPPRRDCSGANAGRPGCRPLDRPTVEPLPDRISPRGEPLGQPPR